MLARDVVDHQVEAQADAVLAEHPGELAQVVHRAEVGPHAVVVLHRVATVVGRLARREQWHQVQVGDTEVGEVRRLLGDPVEGAGEPVGVRRVAEHVLALEPVGRQRPLQVERVQLLGPGREPVGRDLHQPLDDGLVVVEQRAECCHQVGPPAVHSSLEQLPSVCGELGEGRHAPTLPVAPTSGLPPPKIVRLTEPWLRC